jgi:hypothetical protein
MTTMADLTIRPFEVHVPDEELAGLRRRIASARWPHRELVADRLQGVQLATMQELARYCAAKCDWRWPGHARKMPVWSATCGLACCARSSWFHRYPQVTSQPTGGKSSML